MLPFATLKKGLENAAYHTGGCGIWLPIPAVARSFSALRRAQKSKVTGCFCVILRSRKPLPQILRPTEQAVPVSRVQRGTPSGTELDAERT